MDISDLVEDSKDAIVQANYLLGLKQYNRVVHILEMVIGQLRQAQAPVFLADICLAQALTNLASAQHASGNLEEAVNSYREAANLYASSATVQFEEARKQNSEFCLNSDGISTSAQFLLVNTQIKVARASCLYSLAEALEKTGHKAEARVSWLGAKEAYLGLMVPGKRTEILPETLTKAAITVAQMCVKDGELDMAQKLYFLAAAAQANPAPSDTQMIRQGLVKAATLRAMYN